MRYGKWRCASDDDAAMIVTPESGLENYFRRDFLILNNSIAIF